MSAQALLPKTLPTHARGDLAFTVGWEHAHLQRNSWSCLHRQKGGEGASGLAGVWLRAVILEFRNRVRA